jgi:type I restriction enzyme S subunit
VSRIESVGKITTSGGTIRINDWESTMTNATIPAGYKQTEVGIIPEDWGVESLGAIAQIERGKFTARPRNDPKYYGGHIPFIQTGDVANSNGLITCFSQTLNEKGLKVSKVFPAGTLFFTIAANIGDIGFSDFDTACPDSLVAIMPNQKINKFWLAQELKTRKRSFESLATHNAQMNINLEKLKPYLLPIPRIEEQTAIATVLSDVDALIASLNAQIAKKRDIKTATMQQLLTGKQRLAGFGEGKGMKSSELGEIPEDWEVYKLKAICSMKSGMTITAEAISDNADYPCYGGNGLRGFTKKYTHEGHYALVGRQGALCGNIVSVAGKFFASEHAIVVTPTLNTNIKWLAFILDDMNLNQYSESSAQPGLSVEKLLEFQIIVPLKEEQGAAIPAIHR